jgi:hypothetical protein
MPEIPAKSLEAARQAWVKSDSWVMAVDVAYAEGVAAGEVRGRTAAAADLPLILAAIDNALRNGSYMTGDMGTYDMAMPADRDPTYTPDPADVELVARALWAECGTDVATPTPTCYEDARAALAALAAAGRLLPEPTEIRIECEIDWTDLRSSRPGARVNDMSYDWPAEQFEARLAREVEAAEKRHNVPVSMRKRSVSTYADGSTLVGPWLPVPEPTCTCPDCDVSTVGERPGTSTIKGLDPACRIHGKLSVWCACKPGDTCGYHLAHPATKEN